MGAASSFQAAFCGRVEQNEFTQIVDLNTGTTGGFIPVFYRELVKRNAKTQTFTFTGLNETDANTTSPQTVEDFGGTSYTVPMASSATDGSSGTKVFETESVQVTRRRLSPGLWEVVVKRTGSEYWANNVRIINGPSWAFG